jgi:hypothetical protein
VACRRLERELDEAKNTLLKESDDHDTPRLAVGLVLDDLGMTSEEGASSITTQVVQHHGSGSCNGEAGAAPRRAAVLCHRALSL